MVLTRQYTEEARYRVPDQRLDSPRRQCCGGEIVDEVRSTANFSRVRAIFVRIHLTTCGDLPSLGETPGSTPATGGGNHALEFRSIEHAPVALDGARRRHH